jgi:dephospho-CoA kinase
MMTNTLVIALCGARRAGKDEIAKLLTSRYGFSHRKISGTLKSVVSEIFQIPPSSLEDASKDCVDPSWGVTPRQIMQFVGTELFQEKLQDLLPSVKRGIWVQSLCKEIAAKDTPVVISDMRFVHEYELLRRSVRLVCVRVERPRPGGCALDDAALDAHRSETEHRQIPCDFTVVNDGSVDSLQGKVEWLMQTPHLQKLQTWV